MRITFTLLITLSLLLLGLWRLAPFSESPATLTKAATIRVGAVLCLTGICAEWGNQALKGAQLAVEEINSSGGVLGRRIELLVEDSNEEQPIKALQAFQHLRSNQQIDLFLGPTWTPAGLAIAPLAQRDPNFIMISPSLGVKDFNESHDNLFNVWPHDEGISRKLAQHAVAIGLTRVAIMGATQQWSQTQADAFSDELSRQGGQIAAREEPAPTDMLPLAEVSRIIASKPNAVLFTCLGEQLGAAARQLRKNGYRGQFFSVLVDRTTIDSSAGTVEGTIFGQYPAAQEWFKQKFQNAYDTEPGVSADTAYDAIHLIAEAITKSQSLNVEGIQQQLIKTSSFNGASGDITFDRKGGVIRSPTLYTVTSGQMAALD